MVLKRLLRPFRAVLAVLFILGLPVTAAQAGTAVRVGYIPVLGIGQLFVIEGEGWARDAGLTLTLTRFDSGPAMISALVSGTIDAYFGGVAPILVARTKGVGVKVVAATAIEEMTVVGRGDFAATPGNTTAAGFKAFFERTGRPVRIATQPPGSVPDTTLRYWLENVVKVDPAHVSIVAMGIEQTQQALLAGAVDAATVREPAVTTVLDRDPGARLLALGGQMLPNQPGSVLALADAFIARDRDATTRLVALTARATGLLRSDPAAAAVHLQRGLGNGIVPVEVFRRALASPASRFAADPDQIVEATGTLQMFQVRLGELPVPVDLATVFDDSFYRAATQTLTVAPKP